MRISDWSSDVCSSDLLEGREVIAIGHRVVHGGMRFATPRRVDAGLLDALDALCPLAPLHQPHNLAAIHAIAVMAPDLPQIACFDTAFHHDKPEVAARSDVHTSELQSLMRTSYAVFCLTKKKEKTSKTPR